jgi:hypothetical protein
MTAVLTQVREMASPLPLSLHQTAEAILARAPQDMVFTLRLLGQSQELLHSHFRRFLEARLAEAGMTAEVHPLLPYFIDSHAVELRDFVATGVALVRPIRLGEIEMLTGDIDSQMRVEIWDALATHIALAERRFAEGIAKVAAAVTEAEAGLPGGRP